MHSSLNRMKRYTIRKRGQVSRFVADFYKLPVSVVCHMGYLWILPFTIFLSKKHLAAF